jgi:succinylglutamate desuccinylase
VMPRQGSWQRVLLSSGVHSRRTAGLNLLARLSV